MTETATLTSAKTMYYEYTKYDGMSLFIQDEASIDDDETAIDEVRIEGRWDIIDALVKYAGYYRKDIEDFTDEDFADEIGYRISREDAYRLFKGLPKRRVAI